MKLSLCPRWIELIRMTLNMIEFPECYHRVESLNRMIIHKCYTYFGSGR